MPVLTSEAADVLNQFLGLDIFHAIYTRDTITLRRVSFFFFCDAIESPILSPSFLPDCEDSASLGQSSVFLYTTNLLLEDGGDLGRLRLALGCISAGDGGGNGGCALSG